LAYQPPASSTFLSQQTSHQQPVNNTFLSEQTSTSHQSPAKRTGFLAPEVRIHRKHEKNIRFGCARVVAGLLQAAASVMDHG
jgi:hypothetical protein